MSDPTAASGSNVTWAEGRHCFSCGAWIPAGLNHACAGPTGVPPTFIPIPITTNPPATPITVTSNVVWFAQEDRDRMIRIEEKLDELLRPPKPTLPASATQRY